MKVTSSLFATRPTLCEEVSWKRIKPECLNLTVKHHGWMISCCMAHSEVGHCRYNVNCQCDQMHRYTAEVCGAISIALFQCQFRLKDDSEQCYRAKLVKAGPKYTNSTNKHKSGLLKATA